MEHLKLLLEHLKPLFGSFSEHKPEWIAAIALLIQAAILWRHASTLEAHTEIARTQSETARLIGQALEKQGKVLEEQTKLMSDQGKVLDEQTKIMAKQFSFQRKIHAQAERTRVFDVVLDLRAKVVRLKEALALSLRVPPGSTVDAFDQQYIEKQRADAWIRVSEAIMPCQKALLTSIHLSAEETNYFLGYAQAVDALEIAHTKNAETDLQALRNLDGKYDDFAKRMIEAAQPPADDLAK